MTTEKAPKTADERPPFPFELLWPGYGNAEVTLKELLDQVEEYQIFAKLSAQPRYNVRFVSEQEVSDLLVRHEISLDHALTFWVVTAFYLYPRHVRAFGIDSRKSRKTLQSASYHAMMLSRQLSKLSPKVFAALAIMRPALDDVIKEDGGPFDNLCTEVEDFARTARAAAGDLAAAEGRPREHHRDTMFRLLIELTNQIGLNDLSISNGTKARPDPHLKGKAGELIIDMIGLAEPTWTQAWIAPPMKLVRATLRRHEEAGAKNRQS